MRDLRQINGRAALLAGAADTAVLCRLCWQGDFGKGVPTGSGVWSDPGANPCVLYGPARPGSSIPVPQWKPGMILSGDYGAEFVFCQLVLGGTTDLLPGDCYFLDGNFGLTLLSTTNATNVIGAQVAAVQVFAPATPAGTYYVWAQRAGNTSIRAVSGSLTNGQGETNATTPGTLKFPATPTAGQKSVGPAQGLSGSSGLTFTGNTASGSPFITGVVSASTGGGITDLVPGMTITGTGLPANACIAAIDQVGGQWRIAIGTATTGAHTVAQNATASGTGVTFTVSLHVSAVFYWPTLSKQN